MEVAWLGDWIVWGGVEKSKSIDTLMEALEKQAMALKQEYIKYIKRRVMFQGRQWGENNAGVHSCSISNW